MRSLVAAALSMVAGATLLASGTDAHAGGVTVTIVDGRKAKADITLPVPPPGSGNYTAEFELEFENPVLNLTVACLGLTADVLDASAIANVNSRLPDPVHQGIDPAFPVRVTVEPPSGCGLQFYYAVEVEYETDDIVYAPQSQYRLMKAPVGGAFHDITGTLTQGSVRSRGRAGGFSEFVIVKNTAQNYAADAVQSYDALAARIADPSIGLTAQLTLQTDLILSRLAYLAGNYTAAIARLDDLDFHCAALGGPVLPNTWRSQRDLSNAEGEVVSYTANIRFNLDRLNGSP